MDTRSETSANQDPASLDRRARRSQRTRQQLKEALFELIFEKGYDAITVEDITERADLGRTTFYFHFRDKDDLMFQSLNAAYDELRELVHAAPLGQEFENGVHPIRITFSHVAENVPLYRVIFSGQGIPSIAEKIYRVLYEGALVDIAGYQKQFNVIPSLPNEITANYVATIIIGMARWWLDHDMPYSQVEMTQMVFKLLLNGAGGQIGVTQTKMM
jgi:AcrR family transcriptional regulator